MKTEWNQRYLTSVHLNRLLLIIQPQRTRGKLGVFSFFLRTAMFLKRQKEE